MIGDRMPDLQKIKVFAKDTAPLLEMVKNDREQAVQRDEHPKVEMFFSFDIVNSADYKERNRYDWPVIFNHILQGIRSSVNSEFGKEDAILWRVIGDELIFIAKVSDLSLLHENVKSIFKIVHSLSRELKTGKFFKNIAPEYIRKRYAASNTLSLKAAAWIALVTEREELDMYENLSTWYERPESQGNLQEFLGPDIDAGFRVKNYTKSGRLVVSFELACLLSEQTESLECLHILSYQKLKGVWHGDYYPIIWYHMEKEAGKFKDSFQYDERIKDPIVYRYFEREQFKPDDIDPESKISVRMYQDVIAALRKISQDQALENKISHIKKIIEEAKTQDWIPNAQDKFFNDDSRMQMHFAVVCFNRAEKKVLIAKRSDKKSIFPGKWEFGCAKATKETSLVKQIEQEYFHDFHITISVQVDSSRDDAQPIPLALYTIHQQQRHTKNSLKYEVGIVTLAEIKEPFDPKQFSLPEKHSEVRMITEKEAKEFQPSDCVPDFKDTLKKAFQYIESPPPNV